jgi:GNAT superfamily N-acetyltransferase
MDRRDAMRAAELAEADYLYAMFEAADETTRDMLGMAQARFGSASVTVMAKDPTGGFWSRVIGLGVDEHVTAETVDGIIGFARASGAGSLLWQIAPDAEGPWEQLLTDRGAAAGTSWVKFAASVPVDVPETATDLRIGPVTEHAAPAFAEVMITGFGMPDDPYLTEWFTSSTTMPGFRAHGAWDGDRLVGAALSHSEGGRTILCGAATLPSARGRGAQTALMAARFADAADAGSTWVTSETFAETERTGPNPSLRNMRRMGLTELYARRNWRWTA